MADEGPEFTLLDKATIAGVFALDAVVVVAVGSFFIEYWKETALLGLGGFIAWLALNQHKWNPDIKF